MSVIDIARQNVVTQGSDASVADVVRTMHHENVSSVVIIDDGPPLGLVSDRDLAMAVVDEEFDAKQTLIEEFLPDDVVMIEADEGVYDLVELLSEKGVRRVPVIEDGELAGIISLSDVVVLLGMELQHIATAIRSASPAYERSATDFDIFQ